MEGRTIADRYRIDSRIGEGGLATVYRATDLTLDRPVAIKILKPTWVQDPEALLRFRREARAAAKLSHPHVVQVFDTGVDGDTPYLVMEYLPEPNLKQIITEYAPLPSRKVLEVASQCCQALAHIHRQGLVHGDVKPQNILFTEEGMAKLSDFGIASAAGTPGEVSTGMVLGTAHYMSPEQAQGKSIGPQSDLYSLGCIIYEALTGHTPFSGDSAAQVAAKHVRQQPPSPRVVNPSVSTSEEYLISKAMAKAPARRYRSAEEMSADLAKLASGQELDRTGVFPLEDQATVPMRPTPAPVESPPAEPPPTPAPLRRQPQAEATLIWSTVALIVVALVALVLLGWLVTKAFYPGTPPAEVQVPSVRGLTEGEARAKLAQAKLEVGATRPAHDPNKPVGQVIEQYPTEGESVPVGTKVRLTINLGVEEVTVPDVVGLSYRQAVVRLEQAGLSVGELDERHSDEVPEDQIIRHSSHAPGTRVDKGTPIDLVVSKGPEPAVPEEPTAPVEPPEPVPAPAPEPVSVEPHVTISVDETSISPDGVERDYVVKITVLGQKEQQQVKVMKHDTTGGPIVEFDQPMQPGESKDIRVHGRGSTTIEVYHDREVIKEQTFTVEAPPSNNGE